MEMKSLISFIFFLQAIINAVNLTTAQFPANYVYRCRDTAGNYTSRSDFGRNLKVALNKVGMVGKYSGGFFNSSYGGNDAAYALALCSVVGSRSGANCTECVTKLSNTLTTFKCPDQKEAVSWGSTCMVRYSNRNIFGVLDDWVWIFLPERDNANIPSDRPGFDKALHNLMSKLQGEAAQGTDLKKAALGTMTYPPHNRTLYGTMQCTPDLSKELCTKCLQSIILSHHPCCGGKTAAKMFSPNCFFSYSLEDFRKWKPRQTWVSFGTD